MYKMVGCVQKELNSMKEGLHDVIPLDLLSGLAAEVCTFLLTETVVYECGFCVYFALFGYILVRSLYAVRGK